MQMKGWFQTPPGRRDPGREDFAYEEPSYASGDKEREFLSRAKMGEVFTRIGESFSPGKKERISYRSDILDWILICLTPIQLKAYYIIALIVATSTFWLVSAVWIKILMRLQHKMFTQSYSLWSLLKWTFLHEQIIFIVSIAAGAYLALLIGSKYAHAAAKLPDDNIVRPRRPDWTSNDWLNYSPGEIRRILHVTTPKRPVNTPLCMLNGHLLCIPEVLKHWQILNQNIFAIGLSGAGKTYSFLETYILTKIAMSHSFFSADTKGGILEKYEALLIEMGYRVEKLILGDFAHSDGWNLFRHLVEAPASRADDYINNMVVTLVNTAGTLDKRGPDFWTQQEMMLLRGMIYYITRSPAYKGERTLKGFMKLLTSGTEKITQVFAGLPPRDPAYTPSSNFRNSDEKIQDSARSGLQAKLQIFETEAVMECLSYDTINIKEAITRPTATFLVTSDYLETYDVIASLFTSHVYQELTEIADSRPGKKLSKPYYIAVDEICNMAAIKSFSRIISTNRSRNINIAFAIQSLSQFEDKYGALYENIMGNCAVTLFFGCGNQDSKTAKAISERCGKVESVMAQESMSAYPLQPKSLRKMAGSVRYTKTFVELMPPAKAKTLLPDELLVCIAGRNVLRAEPYGAHLHPLSREAEEAKKREDARKAALKEQGIEEWPEWVDHYMAENENAKIPVEKSFPISEFEKEVIPPAYSIAERNRFLILSRIEEEERQEKERRRREFEEAIAQTQSDEKKESVLKRSGAQELAEKITQDMGDQFQQAVSKESAGPESEYDEYDLEDFD